MLLRISNVQFLSSVIIVPLQYYLLLKDNQKQKAFLKQKINPTILSDLILKTQRQFSSRHHHIYISHSF